MTYVELSLAIQEVCDEWALWWFERPRDECREALLDVVKNDLIMAWRRIDDDQRDGGDPFEAYHRRKKEWAEAHAQALEAEARRQSNGER